MKKITVISLITILGCTSSKLTYDTSSFGNYPEIVDQILTEDFYGKEIEDTYRNIENTENPIISDWFKKQTIYAQELLTNIKGRDSFIKRIHEVDNRKSFLIKRSITTEKNNRFYLKKNIDENNYKLYFHEISSEKEVLLFDPKSYRTEDQKKYTINYIMPSWDDHYIVVSLSHSGKELSDLLIVDISSRKILPQIIENTWPSSFSGINWLPDNSGFTYLHFPITDVNDPQFKTNTQSVLYTLGQDPRELNYILGKETNPQLNIGLKEYPTTKIKSSKDVYIVGYISGVDNYWDAYYAKITDIKSGNLNWKPLYKKGQKIKSSKGVFLNDQYIYMTSNNASNFQIESIDVNQLNFNKPTVIFEEKSDEVIDDFEVTSDGIYVTTTKFGIEANLYKVTNGIEKKIKLPKSSGKISLYAKSINTDDIWVSLSGWTSPNVRYKFNSENEHFDEDNLSPKVDYPEFANILVEEVLVTSHDNVEIPLSIIYSKDIKMNGSNPTLFFGYGAYGEAIYPFFSPIFLTWVQDGGIICIPHVRGGGEKGDSWHKAGFKTTKPNTWKDLIACTEYMIEKKYTSKEKTAIYSNSAGGIMVGRAITERPDLFAAAISDSGILNPLRMEREEKSGGSNYKEFGTIKDTIECLGLIEMDSYLHLKKNISYPAVYLTVGMNDPRVMPWMSGKFAAKLQNKTKTKKPVLLNADFNTGHDGSSDIKMYEEWANILCFALWQTGHPDYQLKPLK